ncbi:tail fiber domain-containing protein [Halocola ammonii]
MKKLIFLSFVMLSLSGMTQVTFNNNAPVAGRYVGFNSSANLPLPIRNDGNADIEIWRNLIQRIRIGEINTYNGLNGLQEVQCTRMSLGLNEIDDSNGEDDSYNFAWSMLHLWNDELSSSMQRDWFNVGTSYTTNKDFFYCGLMERPTSTGDDNQSDAILAWGSNETTNPDYFRILFLARTTGQGPAATEQGRETFRITPLGNVGIGDFSSMSTGLNEDPTFKLDVDGNARFRQIQQAAGNVLITGKQEDAIGDYSLRYLSFSGNQNEYLAGDGTWQDVNCEWNINGNDLSMGYAGACQTGSIGIGSLAQGDSKVHIEDEVVNDFQNYRTLNVETTVTADQSFDIGINSDILDQGQGEPIAVNGFARGGKSAIGGRFEARSAQFTSQNLIGVNGIAIDSQSAEDEDNAAFGVYGFARSDLACRQTIGVYGEARNTSSSNCTAEVHAGYFAGDIVQFGNSIMLSDENIKSNITEIQNPQEILMSLQPKSYSYNLESTIGQNLPQGTFHGFIAQEVNESFPSIVSDVMIPAKYDELGNLVQPSETLKGVRYTEVIPVLVAGYQEQQAVIDQQASTISEMQSQIDELYSMVADCCADASNRSQNTGENTDQYELEIEKPSLDQNVPNPFQEKTTITYRLPEQTSIKVLVSDSKGNLVETLVEGQMPEGEYTIRWDATGLESGIYFYSLQSNGIELVKRAVKL